MEIIGIGGEKGGVGKTTLATNLAPWLAARRRRPVILVDADAQQTALKWAAYRAEAYGDNPRVTFVPAQALRGGTIGGELKKMSDRAFVVVDCGGADSPEMRAVLTVADRFVLPLRPGQFDIDTLEKFCGILGEARRFNPGLEVAVVGTQVPSSSRDMLMGEMAQAIAGRPHLRFLGTPIIFRDVYRKAAGEGLSVHEMNLRRGLRYDGQAAAEVTLVCDEVVNAAA